MRCSEESEQTNVGENYKKTPREHLLHELCFRVCTVPFELNVLVKFFLFFFFASFTRTHMPHPFNPADDD